MSYVLVVEDDPLGADAAGEFLAGLGHHVRVVPTPTLAVQLLASSRPDVVLTERRLPADADRALQAACEYFVVPLLDLASAICLMGQTNRRPARAGSEHISTIRSL